MTKVVVVTPGGTLGARSLPPHLAGIAELPDVELTGIALHDSGPLASAGIDTLVLAGGSAATARPSRAVRLLRHATLRSPRWQLWSQISRNPEALRRIGEADIVLMDGPQSIYAGWRIARRFPAPWVMLDGHGVKSLLTNR